MTEEYPNRVELLHLARNLSELLETAIRTKGEMYASDWERMEKMQRKAHLLRHPETLSWEEIEAVVRRRDAAPELVDALEQILVNASRVGVPTSYWYIPDKYMQAARDAIAKAGGYPT